MNTVEVVFPDHIHTAEANSTLWQWDYGQRLVITGAPLPDSYEVHFCNAGDEGTKSQIGDMTGVNIPDEFLLTGKNILAYIYLHTGVDDGETVYKITIKVKPRARPTELFLTEVQHDALDQAIAQLEKYASDIKDIDSAPVQGSRNLVLSGGVYEALHDIGLTVDTEPIVGSNNPISSGAVAAALEHVQPELTVDQIPTENSDNPVSSGGVYEALQEVQSGFADEPDWNENDTTSPNYIKNRSHYKEDLHRLIADTTFVQNNNAPFIRVGYGNYSLAYSNDNYNGSIEPAYFEIECDGKKATVLSEYVTNTESPELRKAVVDATNKAGVYLTITELSSGKVNLSIYLGFRGSIYSTVHISRIDTVVHKISNEFLDMDTEPVDDSTKPITSGAVAAALEHVQPELTVDQTPTEGSDNPVSSGGVYEVLKSKVESPDWAENDTTSPSYIKNRTHSSEEVFTLEKTCFTSKPDSDTPYKYYDGSKQYLVYSSTDDVPCIFAGRWYSVTMGQQEARFGARGRALGTGPTLLELRDIGLYIKSERDATLSKYTFSIYAPYTTEAQAIRIYSFSEVVQKLDNKYLDLSVSVSNSDEKPVTSGAVFTAILNSRTPVDDALHSESANPVENKAIKAALDKKQNKLIFDQTPTAGSAKPVTSDGIYNAIQNIRVQTDDELSENSDHPVKNRVIAAAINGLLDMIQELENRLQAHIDGLDADGNIPIEDATIDEDGYIVFDPSSSVEVDDDGYIVLGS